MGRLADLHRRRAVAKKLRPSVGAEHRYTVAVRGIMRGVRQKALAWLAPKLETMMRQDAPDGSGGGAPPGVGRGRTDLSSQWTAEVERLTGDIAPQVVAPFNRLSTELARKNAQAARSLGLDVRGQLGPHLDDFREWSQSLIKGATRDFGAQVAGVLDDPFTWGLRHEQIAALLKERADVSDSRAKLIARDQTSKLNSSINSFRQRSAGVTSYEWSTSLDERVRDTHAANEGKVFQWGNPPAETGDPGDDVNCRCVAVPIIPDLEDDGAEEPSGGSGDDPNGGEGGAPAGGGSGGGDEPPEPPEPPEEAEPEPEPKGPELEEGVHADDITISRSVPQEIADHMLGSQPSELLDVLKQQPLDSIKVGTAAKAPPGLYRATLRGGTAVLNPRIEMSARAVDVKTATPYTVANKVGLRASTTDSSEYLKHRMSVALTHEIGHHLHLGPGPNRAAVDKAISDAFVVARRDGSALALSTYATQDYSEFFAEAVSAHYHAPDLASAPVRALVETVLRLRGVK